MCDFEQAEHCFTAAARYGCDSTKLWLKWARLYSQEGSNKRNPDLLATSLLKFEKAHLADQENPVILAFWASAETELGCIDEDINILKSAANKFRDALDQNPSIARIWALLGRNLACQAHYFQDAEYYQNALDAIGEGLSIDQSDHFIWFEKARTATSLGDLLQDSTWIEKGIDAYTRASESSMHSNALYLAQAGIAVMKLAELTGELKLMPQALKKFEDAIHLHSKQKKGSPDPEWFYHYGCALDCLGDLYHDAAYYEKAMFVLAEVFEQYPQYEQARYNLSLALYHLGEAHSDPETLEQALYHMRELLAEDQEDELLWYESAMVLMTLGELAAADPLGKSAAYFEDAETHLLRTVALGNQDGYYLLACLEALCHHADAALTYLEMSHDVGVLPPLKELEKDAWLDPLRNTAAFQDFLAQLVN